MTTFSICEYISIKRSLLDNSIDEFQSVQCTNPVIEGIREGYIVPSHYCFSHNKQLNEDQNNLRCSTCGDNVIEMWSQNERTCDGRSSKICKRCIKQRNSKIKRVSLYSFILP